MSNFILVIFVFLIGFGWGAGTYAVLYIPRIRLLLDHTSQLLKALKLMIDELEKVEEATNGLNTRIKTSNFIGERTLDHVNEVIEGDKQLIKSVDRLLNAIVMEDDGK